MASMVMLNGQMVTYDKNRLCFLLIKIKNIIVAKIIVLAATLEVIQ